MACAFQPAFILWLTNTYSALPLSQTLWGRWGCICIQDERSAFSTLFSVTFQTWEARRAFIYHPFPEFVAFLWDHRWSYWQDWNQKPELCSWLTVPFIYQKNPRVGSSGKSGYPLDWRLLYLSLGCDLPKYPWTACLWEVMCHFQMASRRVN